MARPLDPIEYHPGALSPYFEGKSAFATGE